MYAAVTNIAGEHPFSLNLVVDRTQQVIFSAGGTLRVDEPRRVVELVIPVPNVVFPETGTYIVSFHVGGEQIGSRILDVVQAESNPPASARLNSYRSCGKPGCACKALPPRLHGPYYQWTRKVDGKTAELMLQRLPPPKRKAPVKRRHPERGAAG